MSSQIFFKDGGAGLSSVKSTCSGYGIVAAAEGGGSVTASVVGYGIFAAVAGDGGVSDAAGNGSTVGRTGVSGRLEKGADGSLRL